MTPDTIKNKTQVKTTFLGLKVQCVEFWHLVVKLDIAAEYHLNI